MLKEHIQDLKNMVKVMEKDLKVFKTILYKLDASLNCKNDVLAVSEELANLAKDLEEAIPDEN